TGASAAKRALEVDGSNVHADVRVKQGGGAFRPLRARVMPPGWLLGAKGGQIKQVAFRQTRPCMQVFGVEHINARIDRVEAAVSNLETELIADFPPYVVAHVLNSINIILPAKVSGVAISIVPA